MCVCVSKTFLDKNINPNVHVCYFLPNLALVIAFLIAGSQSLRRAIDVAMSDQKRKAKQIDRDKHKEEIYRERKKKKREVGGNRERDEYCI